jgi:hypothetical protein
VLTIQAIKLSPFKFKYLVEREDGSGEEIELDTKTYFLHDVCHFVIEKRLCYHKGFWGMLADGFAFSALFGKDNPQTSELRFIEQIVGPIQSVYMGHFDKKNFGEYIAHLKFEVSEPDLEYCLKEVENIMQKWEHLPIGESLTLIW